MTAAPAIRIRALVLTAAAVVVSGVLWLTPALMQPPQIEPDLVRLSKGMVLIKGLLGSIAAALVLWRLGRPIDHSAAIGYATAICLTLGAVAWLWSLQHILLGGLLFWTGLLCIPLVARRDRLLGEMARRRA